MFCSRSRKLVVSKSRFPSESLKRFNFLERIFNYGRVIFNSEDDVNRLMKERPHVIDGVEVIVHRQTPKSKLHIKDSYQCQHLRLSNAPRTLGEAEIRAHFENYGEIEDLCRSAEQDETWLIKYEE